MTDYSPNLVEHLLYSELRAEGHINHDGKRWVYEGDRCDYEVVITSRKIPKTIRLSED